MILAFLIANVFKEGSLVFHHIQRRRVVGVALVHAPAAAAAVAVRGAAIAAASTVPVGGAAAIAATA